MFSLSDMVYAVLQVIEIFLAVIITQLRYVATFIILLYFRKFQLCGMNLDDAFCTQAIAKIVEKSGHTTKGMLQLHNQHF